MSAGAVTLMGRLARKCSKAIRLVVLRNKLLKTSPLIPVINWLNMS